MYVGVKEKIQSSQKSKLHKLSKSINASLFKGLLGSTSHLLNKTKLSGFISLYVYPWFNNYYISKAKATNSSYDLKANASTRHKSKPKS